MGKSQQNRGADLDLPAGYKVTKFVRHRDNGGIVSGAIDLGAGWNFQLAQVPDFGEFTTLYDAYVIDEVEMRFVLFNNTAEKYPTLLLAPDYDDSAAPTGPNDLLTMEQCKILPFSPTKREHRIRVKPRVAMSVFRTGVTSGYTWGKKSQVMDMALTDIPHYGVRHWLTNYNTTDTAGAVVRVYITYHLRLIGQR